MKNLKTYLMLGLLAIAGQASAAGYGMAGCGIGALAFKDEPGKIQIVAATLNDIIVPQTSAITTGTSNCYDGGSDSAVYQYIDSNKDVLRADISRGKGETLSGLLSMMGCPESAVADSALQKNYGRIFVNEKVAPAADISSNIKTVIRENSISCNNQI